jgi:hypothetical protein
VSAYSDLIVADGPSWYATLGDAAAPVTPLVGSTTLAAVGSPTFGQTAPSALGGISVLFPGTGTDYVQSASGANAAFDLGDGPFTIELWYSFRAIAAAPSLVGKGTSAYLVRLLNAANWDLRKSGSGDSLVTTEKFADSLTWHHLVFTRALATQPIIYVDGAPKAGTPTAQTFANATTGLALGVDAVTPTSNMFNGWLCNVALYTKVLTPSQVTAHFLAGGTTSASRTDGRGFHPGAGPLRTRNFRRLPSANGVVTNSFFGDAATTVTATLAAAGVAATSSDAATTVTASLAASGAAGVSTGAATTVTATLAATGSVTSGGNAATTITATLTATGNVATTGAAATTVTATLIASGNIATSTGAATTVTATLAATGTVGKSSGAATTITATLTATGTAAAGPNSGAATTIAAILAAAGTVGKFGAATTVITAGLGAAGSANLTGAAATTVTVALTAVGTAAGATIPGIVTGSDHPTTMVTSSDTGSGITGTDRSTASVASSDRSTAAVSGTDRPTAAVTSS